jgi:CoA:oxalate CoA-transferase
MASTLDGITVVDLSEGRAGAYATMFLSDHGARVIRIEDTHNNAPRDGGFLVWDRGKECVRLDLTQIQAPNPAAQAATQAATNGTTAAYEQLIRSADVLVEDFAPASDRQAMVNVEWLFRLNPRLIACSITAYGKHGPRKRTGLPAATGASDSPPTQFRRSPLCHAWDRGCIISKRTDRPGS